MKNCAACGVVTKAPIALGGTILCRQCEPAVAVEIEQLRSDGKPVNVAHIARRIYRAEHCAGDYLLRDIPQELWTAAKHRAVDENVSLRDLVLKSLAAYLG